MAEAYFKRRLKRAFEDTIQPLGWNRQTLWLAVQTAAATLIGVYFFGGATAAVDRFTYLAATAFGLGIVFIGNFIWNYVAAPSRMQADADANVEMLEGQLNKIRDKQDSVDHLSGLLSIAIREIWNRPVRSSADLDALEDYWMQWQTEVASYLDQHFSQSDKIHFDRLGVVPNVGRPDAFDSRHAKILREYALKESRLREIIRDHNVTHI